MKMSLIVGSHRPQSASAKVARFIESLLKPAVQTYTLDLAVHPLPLWDEGMWSAAEKWKTVWGPHAAELRSSDGIVVISPEWGGMVPSGLKNVFLLCGQAELGHKPGLIVGVSASRGGAYPVAELRMSSYKNNGLCYIPEHVIVRDAANVLNDLSPGAAATGDDAYIRGRLAYATKLLVKYAECLRGVRESGLVDTKTYPFGM